MKRKGYKYFVCDDSAILGMHYSLKAAKRTLAWGRADERRSGYPVNPHMGIFKRVG